MFFSAVDIHSKSTSISTSNSVNFILLVTSCVGLQEEEEEEEEEEEPEIAYPMSITFEHI